MPKRYAEQARKIREFCYRARLSPEQMADKIAVKPDTMRKYMGPDGDARGGYQPCSDQMLNSMALVANYEESRREGGLLQLNDAPSVSKTDIAKKLDDITRQVSGVIYSLQELKGRISNSFEFDQDALSILDQAEHLVDLSLESGAPQTIASESHVPVSRGSKSRPSVPKKSPS